MNSFFHSAYTKDGFRHIKLSTVNPDCFRYILKGRSDEVKANLFKKVISELEHKELNFSIALNYNENCSAVLCEQKGFILCDGTYPFKETSVTYGGTDGIISLEKFQNDRILRQNAERIVSGIKEAQELEKKCARFISAMAGVSDDGRRLEKEFTDSAKISRYTARLWSKHGCPPSGKVGVEKKVFFTVPASDGLKCAEKNLNEYCDLAIVITGGSGYCSEMIIDRIRRYALSSGTDVISCQSFLDYNATPDHVIIPALRFGVFTDYKDTSINVPVVKKVRAKRFEVKNDSDSVRVRRQFNQRAYDSLQAEVYEVIKRIDKCNKELDEIYLGATNEQELTAFVLKKLGL